MANRTTDPEYLASQYGDSERLRIRIETHRRYSERPDTWVRTIVGHLQPRPGGLVADIGCGPGSFHPQLVRHGMRVVGIDSSKGMIREAREQATRGRLPVHAVQADAQALPLADRTFDRVMATHVLFHVPDVRLALQEMRRVVKPGGRVLFTTNAADHSKRLHDLHRWAARESGYTVADLAPERHFSLDDFALVRSVLPTAQCHVNEDAFLFPSAEPALRFYASGMIDWIEDRPADGSHRARLMPLVADQVRAIIAREGVFRVPKNSGCFVAQV